MQRAGRHIPDCRASRSADAGRMVIGGTWSDRVNLRPGKKTVPPRRPRPSRARPSSARPRRAFTLIELLVVIGIIAVLMAILLPLLGHARASSQSTACLSNLRNIMQAFNLYANDNQQHLPPPSDPAKSDQSWESYLKKYLATRDAFRCPADNVAFENYLSSYDWRDTPDPRTTLAGRMIVEIQRPDAVFVFDALPEWHARQRINTAWADGSVKSMEYPDWAKDLEKPVSPPYTIDNK